MASDGRNITAEAVNIANSSTDDQYAPPEQRRWKVYLARYWCFKSQRRKKRVTPASRSEGTGGSARGWPHAQAGLALAPPSSPASFINSTVQSPASFTLSLSAVSASMCSPSRPNTMFTIGPYAHETQLVSPPVFSTFTTEPSTAPFTPPPELAHLTTPSSPDVPFAQYIASSLEARSVTREAISPLSMSTLASPCDTPVSYTPASSHHYLGSPVGRLVSPTVEYSSGEVTLDEKHPAYSIANLGHTASSFPTFDPFASSNFDGVPFAAFILPSDTHPKCEESPPSVLLDCDSKFEHDASMCKEVCEITLKSEMELDLKLGQGITTGSMQLEVCDGYCDSMDCVDHLRDGAFHVPGANDLTQCIANELKHFASERERPKEVSFHKSEGAVRPLQYVEGMDGIAHETDSLYHIPSANGDQPSTIVGEKPRELSSQECEGVGLFLQRGTEMDGTPQWSDGVYPISRANEDENEDKPCIYRGQKLQELLSRACDEKDNEKDLLQNFREMDTSCKKDVFFKTFTSRMGRWNEIECTVGLTDAQTGNRNYHPAASVDHLKDADMRPVIFELDD